MQFTGCQKPFYVLKQFIKICPFQFVPEIDKNLRQDTQDNILQASKVFVESVPALQTKGWMYCHEKLRQVFGGRKKQKET